MSQNGYVLLQKILLEYLHYGIFSEKEIDEMYQEDFEAFLQSEEYRKEEMDPVYAHLRQLLQIFLEMKPFLDIEELLHEEIVRKLELGFRYGYESGQKAAQKKKQPSKEQQ